MCAVENFYWELNYQILGTRKEKEGKNLETLPLLHIFYASNTIKIFYYHTIIRNKIVIRQKELLKGSKSILQT